MVCCHEKSKSQDIWSAQEILIEELSPNFEN